MLQSIYLAALVCLCLVGLHRLLILVASLRPGDTPSPPPPYLDESTSTQHLPVVTVQLPVYNERFVVRQLIEAVASLEYPAERLEIQVLDDSDDGTSDLVAHLVDRLRTRGVDIQHLRRTSRQGFKAGALAHGLKTCRGELIAIFDADFRPMPDLLRRIVPEFVDPSLGLIQARWGHVNRRASLLTRTQAMQLDGHFLVEHIGRQNAGVFLNFNGTAGVLRRSAIGLAGGWQSDTLTEDLDLSCRAQLQGWQFRYRPQFVVPGQLPESMGAYKSQQRRWTRGSVQTARKLLIPIWRSPARVRIKVEASALLLGNSSYPLLLAFCVAHGIYWTLGPGTAPGQQLRFLDTGVLGSATLVLWFYYALAGIRADRGWLPALLEVPLVIALGAGMSINNTLAFLQGLLGQTGTFDRTPKPDLRADGATADPGQTAGATPRPEGRSASEGERSAAERGARADSDPCGSGLEPAPDASDAQSRRAAWYRSASLLATGLELALGFGATAGALRFFGRAWRLSAAFYLLFAGGLLYVGGSSVIEGLARRARARSRSQPSAIPTAPYSTATTQAFSAQTPTAR